MAIRLDCFAQRSNPVLGLLAMTSEHPKFWGVSVDISNDTLYIQSINMEQMMLRIDPDLKTKASSLARAEGKNISQVMRELLHNYIQERDIGAYAEDLWCRIGRKLKAKGAESGDISRVLREVRRKS